MKSAKSVLVVDDDFALRSYLFTFLTSGGLNVVTAESGEEAIAHLNGGYSPSLVILDMILPGIDGIEVLQRIKAQNQFLPVIILSGSDQSRVVVQAMQAGAVDFLTKPIDDDELSLAIRNVFEEQERAAPIPAVAVAPSRIEGHVIAESDLLTGNPKILAIKKIAERTASTDVPLLILGESGTGKEVLARYVHSHSDRRANPFIKVNCAAVPENLLESELFGYQSGAFTGALKDKPGKFEIANKGTLLLDEIGEMSPNLQAKLLHVLQDGEYSPLGARRPVRVDVRVLAATNIDILKFVADGKFREDLYYRLNVVRVDIPPLRERREDIPMLCEFFVRKYAARYGSNVTEIPPALLSHFLKYHWPGNVRQLENVVKRYLILPDIDGIIADCEVSGPGGQMPASVGGPAAAERGSLLDIGAKAAMDAEKDLVLETLKQTGWNRKEAARRLSISYKGLRNKLKRWGLVGVKS